ncbi:hypothetical protein RJ639_006297 [Escallonia herrerae]|uniref:TF-B3 domain-containing protein n=1 Tax=Escallonia herrerae TaxID=1293975 RepID=A0AA88VUB7_9ASTE|nr:hypothetical protein RJ639_006297 [Escallonia herrerae]
MNRMQPEARILGGVSSIGKPPWNGPRLPFRRCMYSCLKLESTIENVRRENLRTKSKTQGPNGGLENTQSRKGRIRKSKRLQAETSIILRVGSGKSWPVKLCTRKSSASTKRTSMTKGWDEFYASNKLKEGDVCHFELRPRARRSNTTIILDVRRLAIRFWQAPEIYPPRSWPVSRRFHYPMLMLGSPTVRGLNYKESEKALMLAHWLEIQKLKLNFEPQGGLRPCDKS